MRHQGEEEGVGEGFVSGCGLLWRTGRLPGHAGFPSQDETLVLPAVFPADAGSAGARSGVFERCGDPLKSIVAKGSILQNNLTESNLMNALEKNIR